MRKSRYYVRHECGNSAIVEARSGKGAIEEAGWKVANVVSVAKLRSLAGHWELLADGVKIELEDGAELSGDVKSVNAALNAMGYEGVQISVNLIGGRRFIEEIGTPGYLSPRSEAYWSN